MMEEKIHSIEGVTSLGPGVERNWNFEFPLDSGEWTFALSGSDSDIKMGPFAHDFEYSATQGRKLSNTMGSSLFAGAFGDDLEEFGNVREREVIDPSKVVMTSYSAENSRGGDTLIKADLDKLSTGMTSTSGLDARSAPILNSNPVREAPMSQSSRTNDPLLAHNSSSSSMRESPMLPSQRDEPAAQSPDPLLAPITPKPKPQPPADPPASSKGPPLPPATPPPSSPPWVSKRTSIRTTNPSYFTTKAANRATIGSPSGPPSRLLPSTIRTPTPSRFTTKAAYRPHHLALLVVLRPVHHPTLQKGPPDRLQNLTITSN